MLLKKGQKATATINFGIIYEIINLVVTLLCMQKNFDYIIYLADNVNFRENSSVTARVIDYDLVSRTIFVSLHPDMIHYGNKQFYKMHKQVKYIY